MTNKNRYKAGAKAKEKAEVKETLKKDIGIITLIVLAFQLGRLAAVYITFHFVEESRPVEILINLLYMVVVFEIMRAYNRKTDLFCSYLPKKIDVFTIAMIMFYFLLAFSFVAVTFAERAYSTFGINVLYATMMLVLVEEILFRGLIYQKIMDDSSEERAFFISIVLYIVWTMLASDKYAWDLFLSGRVGLIGEYMLMRLIQGFVCGIVFTALRKKSGAILAPALAHAIANIFLMVVDK